MLLALRGCDLDREDEEALMFRLTPLCSRGLRLRASVGEETLDASAALLPVATKPFSPVVVLFAF